MKKTFATVLVALLAASSLSACGSNDSEGTKDNGSSSSDVPTVNVLMINDGKSDICDQISETVSAVTEEKVGAKIKLTRGSTKESLNLALTSGEDMDLFAAVSWYVSLASMVSNDQVLPLDDLLAEHGKTTYDAISEDDWKCCQVNGEIYGVPMNKDKSASKGFMMRKEIVDELGIDVSAIKTYDDLEKVLLQVKEAHPELYPVVSNNGTIICPFPMDDLFDTLGVLIDVFSDSTEVVNLYETEYYKDFVTRMYDWAQKGLWMPDATTANGDAESMIGATGFGAFASLKPGFEAQASRVAGLDIVTCELAAPFSLTSQVAQVWCISAASENPEKAMEVLDLMYNDSDIANTFIYGVEGINWEWKDKEQNIVGYPEGVDASNSGYDLTGYAWPNQQIGAVFEGDDPDVWTQLSDMNANATPSPAKGFTWDNSNVLNEVTACNNVVNKYKNGLECGMLNPEEVLPQFIKELKDAGIDTIVEEKQAQLDAWLAEQK